MVTKKLKKVNKPAKPEVDVTEEIRLDWECATRFNKLIWSKWPKSVESIVGLCEWLEKKGYVVRYKIPMAGHSMHTRRWAVDLLIDEQETIFQIFHPEGLPKDEKVCEKLRREYQQAQRSGLVCMTNMDEFDGNSLLFVLFREKGTANCLVFITYSSI